MVLILTFLLFITFFLIIIDFFTILFRLTGMPIDKARFQVVSLLTSTGFTTKESEIVTQHPVRRRLAAWLMIFSYASTATIISFLIKILSNVVLNKESVSFTFISIIVFIVIVYAFQKSSLLERIEGYLERIIIRSRRWSAFFNNNALISISTKKGYGIFDIYLNDCSSIVGKTILNSDLKDHEIQVLSIDKGDKMINFPTVDYVFAKTDKVTVYGNIKNINKQFCHVSGKKRKLVDPQLPKP